MLFISVSISLLLLDNFLIIEDFWTALNSWVLMIIVYFIIYWKNVSIGTR